MSSSRITKAPRKADLKKENAERTRLVKSSISGMEVQPSHPAQMQSATSKAKGKMEIGYVVNSDSSSQLDQPAESRPRAASCEHLPDFEGGDDVSHDGSQPGHSGSDGDDEAEIDDEAESAYEKEAKELLKDVICSPPFQTTIQRTPRAVLQRKLEWLQNHHKTLETSLHNRRRRLRAAMDSTQVQIRIDDYMQRKAVCERQIRAAEWMLDL